MTNPIEQVIESLAEIVAVLGPEPICGSDGCEAEIGVALDAARSALSRLRALKVETWYAALRKDATVGTVTRERDESDLA